MPSSNYSVDIDNQSPGNYAYDRIGNLKKDVAEGIDDIRWNVYGKINRTTKTAAGTIIDYSYDAGGNRTMKQVTAGTATTTTYYVRDAQGNVLAVYTRNNNDAVKWSEQHLYGSSRLGMWRWDTIVPASAPVIGNNDYIYDSITLGSRTYELANHLGNVLATISDKKIGVDSNGVVKNYIAEVLSQNDYYPFGMGMPVRTFTSSSEYRYGFNGKENNNEILGIGNLQDYGLRNYDPRTGRFLSIDPLTKKYPWYTPYLFAGNKPIKYLDLDGAEESDPEEAVEERESFEETFKENLRNHNEELEREREEHLKRDPIARWLNNSVETVRLNDYWKSAFNSASFVLTGGNVRDNQSLGTKWEDYVYKELSEHPEYIGVARQISLKITGTVNGDILTARIRIDNVGIRMNSVTGQAIFDLKEAKYSISDLSINNIKKTLTQQQKLASEILINGKDVQVHIRGEGSASKINQFLGQNIETIKNGQNITAHIGEINIQVPKRTKD